jgi:hypothetical protein
LPYAEDLIDGSDNLIAFFTKAIGNFLVVLFDGIICSDTETNSRTNVSLQSQFLGYLFQFYSLSGKNTHLCATPHAVCHTPIYKTKFPVTKGIRIVETSLHNFIKADPFIAIHVITQPICQFYKFSQKL